MFLEPKLARERVPLCRKPVLVVERRVGTTLVIDIARMAIGEVGDGERRVERLIRDALRFPLAPLTVQSVDGELVVGGWSIGRVARDGMHERNLCARSVFLQIAEWSLEQVLPKDVVVARPAVAHERVTAVGRERTALQTTVRAAINVPIPFNWPPCPKQGSIPTKLTTLRGATG